MSVVDASVFVDAVAVDGPAGDAARRALRHQSLLDVPAIFPAEVTSALRSMLLQGALADGRARAALVALRSTAAVHHPFDPFLERVWALRDHLTPYDAWYVALAEGLDTVLVTADERLAAAPGVRCEVEHLGA